jgi:hypothetical protein
MGQTPYGRDCAKATLQSLSATISPARPINLEFFAGLRTAHMPALKMAAKRLCETVLAKNGASFARPQPSNLEFRPRSKSRLPAQRRHRTIVFALRTVPAPPDKGRCRMRVETCLFKVRHRVRYPASGCRLPFQLIFPVRKASFVAGRSWKWTTAFETVGSR